ncbi:heat shock protein 30 [Wolfiporia cocos MD-104 SS10]|uniref:Heat shock protein 30 n=1 Tax=Wolfiporia cocos (strain MD-104) TaxID=742152 RepID=A0A2H3JLT6_WOLCO|nr:heat shock protein 30 [Wolfiporia cocos MD-104 SS10]
MNTSGPSEAFLSSPRSVSVYFDFLAMAGNQALHINPPNADEHLTTHGSDWLWAVFAIMTLCICISSRLTHMKPRGSRMFNQIAVVVLSTSSVAYLSMAADLGATPIDVEFRGHGGHPSRQIWYVRYIQWFINFPLLLVGLLCTTGLSLSDILSTVYFAIFMVVCALIGALVKSSYKWGYFGLLMATYIYMWQQLLWHAPRSTFAAGGIVRRGYYVVAGYLAFMITLYPICWALAEGANVISVTSEMIWYGILDLLTGPGFLFLFLWELRGADYNAFGLQSGKHTGYERSAPRSEKEAQFEQSATASGDQAA